MISTVRAVVLAILVMLAGGCAILFPDAGEVIFAEPVRGPVDVPAPPAETTAELAVATDPAARERRLVRLSDTGIDPVLAGGTGYYMDVQEARLRQQFSGKGVPIVREGEAILLGLGTVIRFETDSATLAPDFRPVLDAIAEVLIEFSKTVVTVEGHTDDVGPEDHNEWLSGRRALAVGRYLAGMGIDAERLVIIGHGPAHPVASNETPEGRQQNRRVEIRIEPVIRIRDSGEAGLRHWPRSG